MTEKTQEDFSPEKIAKLLGKPAPTPEQSEIIRSDLRPCLVIAGAGSGKTATMVDRVIWLVANQKVRPEEILGVTFTRKAAGELRERMRIALNQLRHQGIIKRTDQDEEITDPVVSTYHSYAKSLVSDYGLRLGIEQDAQLLGQAQSWQLMAQIVEHLQPEIALEDLMSKSTIIKDALTLASECSEHLVTPERLQQWCEDEEQKVRNISGNRISSEQRNLLKRLQQRRFYAGIIQEYRNVKKRMQVMDYGDLVSLAARIAKEFPMVSKTEQERYKVVLLDEFQDTSHAQMQLFSDLFGHRADPQHEHAVMAVGDPKQSIYGFRGASDGQLYNFYQYFPTANKDTKFLTIAWRNDVSILTCANTLATPLSKPADWSRAKPLGKPIPHLQPRPTAEAGKVLLGGYNSTEEEAQAIAQKIYEERHKPEYSALNGSMPTMAILCKKRAMMEPIRKELEALSIPYQVVGLGGLLDTPEVVEMVCYLRVLSDPGRSDALMRILSGARWRLGTHDLLALGDWARHLARRREHAIKEGIREKLTSDETHSPAGSEGDERPLNTVESILSRACLDNTDDASLIEAIETLPPAEWVSAQGRQLSTEGLNRLQRCAEELTELRQYMNEDLTTLLYEIEQKILLDIELAVKPDTSSHHARRNLDAFYESAANYMLTAPRLWASLRATQEQPHNSEKESPSTSQKISLYAGLSGTSMVSGFLAWLEAAAQEESGLEMMVDPPSREAVQLLTVHASKGLEWDHVYIPGLCEGDFPITKDQRWTQCSDSLPTPLRGDNDFMPPWISACENTKELKESLEIYQEQTLEHTTTEERRLAYVGVTRARSLLMLTHAVWKGSNKTKNKVSTFWEELYRLTEGHSGGAEDFAFEVLSTSSVPEEQKTNPQSEKILSALWPFDPIDGPVTCSWDSLEELEETPEPKIRELHQHTKPSRRQRVEHAAQEITNSIEEHSSLEASDSENPLIRQWGEESKLLLSLLQRQEEEDPLGIPQHLNTSTVVSLIDDPQKVLDNTLRPIPQRPTISARQGNLFHSWIENYYEKPATLEFDEEYAEEENDEIIHFEKFTQNFLASPWANTKPWAVEYPFETPLAGTSVRGRIDAIFRHEQPDGSVRWELVDWKTGRVPTTKQLAHLNYQLAVYRIAFSRLHNINLEDIDTAFCYVSTGDIIRPEKLATEDELEKIIREKWNRTIN
ncbi:ATP-dependent helicase [Rothia sp. P13129]|uniref:ATP-dependent helicase n=1 Tax=Rothia sp. P13129 TaxID=3402664 RepID=UPI003ACC2718